MRGLWPGKATFVLCPHARLGRAKNCIASYSTFSVVNMDISKSYLDLHLSESDWCRFVVEFGLSDLTEKPTRDGNRIKILNPTLALTPLGLLSPWRCHPTLI